MSVPFTIGVADPVTGIVGSWQEKAEELRLAYSERYYMRYRQWRKFAWRSTAADSGVWEWQAGDGSASDVLPLGVNLQASAFWSAMQGFFQSMAGYVSKPGVDYTGEPGVGFYFDSIGPSAWEKFCEWVGDPLYTSAEDYGWPRSVEMVGGEPVMLRGVHQEGDYLGPWVVESLRKVMEHWMRVRLDGMFSVGFPVNHGWYDVARMTEQRAEIQYAWGTESLEWHVDLALYLSDKGGWGRTAKYNRDGLGNDEVFLTATKASIALVSAPFDLTWDLYGAYGSDWHSGIDAGAVPAPATAPPSVKLFQSGLAASGVSAVFGNNDSSDAGLDIPPPPDGTYYSGYTGTCAVADVDFTNGPAEPI